MTFSCGSNWTFFNSPRAQRARRVYNPTMKCAKKYESAKVRKSSKKFEVRVKWVEIEFAHCPLGSMWLNGVDWG